MINWFKLVIAICLILLNAFFVIVQFAYVAVRKTRIAELSKTHDKARHLLRALNSLDYYISVVQFGSSVTGVALGWLGEPAIAYFLFPLFDLFPKSYLTSHAVAAFISFVLITFVHIIVGELAPKTIALEKSEKMALLTIGPLEVFARIFYPVLVFLNMVTNGLIRLIGFQPLPKRQSSHSAEEIKMIVTQSGRTGSIAQEEARLTHNVFQLGSLSAAEIMTQREDVIAFEGDETVEQVTNLIEKLPFYSRFPTYNSDIDHITGFVHIKDLFHERFHNRNEVKLAEAKLIRKIMFIPPHMKLEHILIRMRQTQIQIAIVQDKDKKTLGVITLEDVLESLVGEIEDEFDEGPTLSSHEAF